MTIEDYMKRGESPFCYRIDIGLSNNLNHIENKIDFSNLEMNEVILVYNIYFFSVRDNKCSKPYLILSIDRSGPYCIYDLHRE